MKHKEQKMKNVVVMLALLVITGCSRGYYVSPRMLDDLKKPSASSSTSKDAPKVDDAKKSEGAKSSDNEEPKQDPAEVAEERMRRQQVADDEAAAEAEEPAYTKAMKDCANTRPVCTRKCEAGDNNMTCLGLALVLTNATPPDFKEAVRLADKACTAGSKAACIKVEHIRESEKKYARELDGGWSTVTGIGDDLATKKFLHAFASTHLTGRRNAVAAGRMQQHIQAITAESFCPAKKEFIAAAGATDYARRSKKHCAEEPPTATGLSGEEQTLTAECTAVFATPCP